MRARKELVFRPSYRRPLKMRDLTDHWLFLAAEGIERKDPSYYQYELAGILVHTGTADYGHYYSFIRVLSIISNSEGGRLHCLLLLVQERLPKEAGQPCKWYQFNDTLVEPFDPEEIPKTCYGGTDTVTEWDEVAGKHLPKWRPKTYNAYMLFYQRVKVQSVS